MLGGQRSLCGFCPHASSIPAHTRQEDEVGQAVRIRQQEQTAGTAAGTAGQPQEQPQQQQPPAKKQKTSTCLEGLTISTTESRRCFLDQPGGCSEELDTLDKLDQLDTLIKLDLLDPLDTLSLPER